MPTRHDQAFKNLVLDFPRDALRFLSPEELSDLPDDVQIRPLRQEQKVAQLGRRHRVLDVPLELKWPSGQRETLVVVLEAECRGRALQPNRLGAYCLEMAELTQTNRVVPLVVSLDDSSRENAWHLATERGRYLSMHWRLCQLGQIDPQPWLFADNIVARLCLPQMRLKDHERPVGVRCALRGLIHGPYDLHMRDKYVGYVGLYSRMESGEFYRMVADVEDEMSEPDLRGLIGARKYIADRKRRERKAARALRQEGRQEGAFLNTLAILARLFESRGLVVGEGVLANVLKQRPSTSWSSLVVEASRAASVAEWLARLGLDPLFPERLRSG